MKVRRIGLVEWASGWSGFVVDDHDQVIDDLEFGVRVADHLDDELSYGPLL